MNRSLPLWAFLLCLLVGALFLMTFGWAVRTTMLGNDRSGAFGRAAVAIAAFPSTTKQVLAEVMGYASGDYADAEVSIPREKDPEAAGFAAPDIGIDDTIPGLAIRRTRETAPGWRLISGTFEIDDEPTHAALLISPELKVVRLWRLEERAPEGVEIRPRHKIFPHGIELLPNGSVIAAFDGGTTLQRIGPCGDHPWTLAGEFHHALTLAPDGQSVWGLYSDAEGWGDSLAEVDVASGTVMRRITMDEIIAANPEIDIFGPRRLDRTPRDPVSNQRNSKGSWLTDPFHLNDVDPLPSDLAEAFPMFEAGDLLVSARSLNLVFVVDPDTAKVKWWRSGMVRRQHDPDWDPSGEIRIYDNGMGRDASRILAVDPSNFRVRTVLDGSDHAFFSRIRGKQQVRPDGGLVVTSPQQGYAFETGPGGDITFEVVNAKPGSSDRNYVLSELRWYPQEMFEPSAWTCPGT